ncbi:MAG: Nin-like protein, partial [Bacteroidota bacterium]
MLWRFVQAHGGELPPDVVCAFANTGKEMPQTLDFVRHCGERWGVKMVWLEYRAAENPQGRWAQVTYETASRKGEPFKALIDAKKYLPNPVTRFCTTELKIRPIKYFCQQRMGWDEWFSVIGLRADEPRRVSRSA